MMSYTKIVSKVAIHQLKQNKNTEAYFNIITDIL